MKALVVGIGLIGARHVEILNDTFGIQTYSWRSKSVNAQIVENIETLERALAIGFDFLVIANPTNLHADTIDELKVLKVPVFLEKPIDVDRKALDIIKNSNLLIYVAYCLRFNPVIKYLKDYCEQHAPRHIYIINNNCLEAWPRLNKDSYSRYKNRGGGVVMDLSHEIDYMYFIAGIKSVLSFRAERLGRFTEDAVDNLIMHCNTNLCPGVIYLNYHGHRADRRVIIDFDDVSLEGDLKKMKVSVFRHRELIDEICFDGRYDDMYIDQWQHFIQLVKKGNQSDYNFSEAEEVFKILLNLNEGTK